MLSNIDYHTRIHISLREVCFPRYALPLTEISLSFVKTKAHDIFPNIYAKLNFCYYYEGNRNFVQ